jgi:cation-transporting ATPase 13A3/4/5
MLHHPSNADTRQFAASLIRRGVVFARIQPQQKTFLVETLIEQHQIVGMCGDGTNDCGALKSAHFGLALSTAEASIVAPFTSRHQRITDIVDLIREGRCALTTSFTAFKFMILYPVIQSMMSASLNQLGVALGNNQFLFDDLVIVLTLSLTMLYTRPSERLGRLKAQDNLFAFTVLGSVIGQIAICIILFAVSWVLLFRQPWFCPAYRALELQDAADGNPLFECYPINFEDYNQYLNEMLVYAYENNVTWLFTHWQFWIVAFVFNLTPLYFYTPNKPKRRWRVHCSTAARAFRRPFYTNLVFTGCLIGVMIILWVVLMQGVEWWAVASPFGLISQVSAMIPWPEPLGLPYDFRWMLMSLVGVHLVVAMVWEVVLVPLVAFGIGRND